MKKIMTLMLGLALTMGATAVFADDAPAAACKGKKAKKGKKGAKKEKAPDKMCEKK